jgi:hypothetical protein
MNKLKPISVFYDGNQNFSLFSLFFNDFLCALSIFQGLNILKIKYNIVP